MPIAQIVGTIVCPKCPAFALKFLDSGRMLLCDHCGKVYAAPSIELVEIGDRVPDCYLPPNDDCCQVAILSADSPAIRVGDMVFQDASGQVFKQ